MKKFFYIILLLTHGIIHCEQTWVEVDGKIYGAKPNEQGPIGGGEGYKDIISNKTYTVTTVKDFVDKLKIAKSGDIIFIPGDTELDLSEQKETLKITEGVIIAGERGNSNFKGALLLFNGLQPKVKMLVTGKNIRLTGLRIQGDVDYKNYPSKINTFKALKKMADTQPEYDKLLADAYKRGTDFLTTTFDNLTVDNCEISGFGHAAIFLKGGKDHHIHHNYIHHCQYWMYGYGISHSNAESTIEYNRFNFNRHSIASTGDCAKDHRTNYIAQHNFDMGEPTDYGFVPGVANSAGYIQCFDIHGGIDRKDGTDIAGCKPIICNNTFGYPGRKTAIRFRGIPKDTATVTNNWFIASETIAEASPIQVTPEDKDEVRKKIIIKDNLLTAKKVLQTDIDPLGITTRKGITDQKKL